MNKGRPKNKKQKNKCQVLTHCHESQYLWENVCACTNVCTHTQLVTLRLWFHILFQMSEWERENLQWHFIVHHQRWKDGRGRSKTVGKRVTNHTVTSAIYHSPHSPFLLYLPCTQSRHLWQARRQQHTQTRTANHTLTHTQAIVLPFTALYECELAGLQAGVQRLALFQDWSSQANSATTAQSLFFKPSHSFSIFLPLSAHPFPLLRSLLSWSAASAFTMGWSVTFAKIYHISVQHNKQGKGGLWAQRGGDHKSRIIRATHEAAKQNKCYCQDFLTEHNQSLQIFEITTIINLCQL